MTKMTVAEREWNKWSGSIFGSRFFRMSVRLVSGKYRYVTFSESRQLKNWLQLHEHEVGEIVKLWKV